MDLARIPALSCTLFVLIPCLSFGQKQGLTFRPVAADYSAALDRIVMVAPSPNALYSYDATNNITDTVPDRCAQELLRFLKSV